MPYIDKKELFKRVPADIVGILSNDQGDSEPVDKIILEAIEDAQAYIDGFLGSLYTVPLTGTIPQLILSIHCDLAAYFLYTRKYREEIPDAVQARYDRSVDMLERISKGKVRIDITVVEAVTSGGAIRTNKTSESRIFTSDLLDRM